MNSNIHGPNVPSSTLRKGDLDASPLAISDIDEHGAEILTLFQMGCHHTFEEWGCEVDEHNEGDRFVTFFDGESMWMDDLPDFFRMEKAELFDKFNLNFWAGIQGVDRMPKSFLFALPELCGRNPENLTLCFPSLFKDDLEIIFDDGIDSGNRFIEYIG